MASLELQAPVIYTHILQLLRARRLNTLAPPPPHKATPDWTRRSGGTGRLTQARTSKPRRPLKKQHLKYYFKYRTLIAFVSMTRRASTRLWTPRREWASSRTSLSCRTAATASTPSATTPWRKDQLVCRWRTSRRDSASSWSSTLTPDLAGLHSKLN